ncbi:MAG: hypothetical protein HW384_182 [Dehalococcoidia bacterium]|nr:hypothetical protein [Dehalococcoidia bacterium]
MNKAEAQRVIESLRKGIPPDGFVRHFTVGRKSEVQELRKKLEIAKGDVLLIQANYGAGKSHLLQFVREQALADSYAVSTVTLDSKGAVKFSRMDQMFAAICRGIEIPYSLGTKGIRPFFNLLVRKAEDAKVVGGPGFWHQLTRGWRWDYSESLSSAAIFISLRAWAVANPNTQDMIEDYLYQPWQYKYKGQQKKLYIELVEHQRNHFRDPRSEQQFYAHETFMFHVQGYAQSWQALRDINTLAVGAGLRGLVILFDEFEDVVTNLTNIKQQQEAFFNLFQFYGTRFPGISFYAVTPEFTSKCKNRLLMKNCWDYDLSRFDRLAKFEMSPLEESELEELAERILKAHSIAYEWDPHHGMEDLRLKEIVHKAASLQTQDRARHTIISVVKALDDLLEQSE